MDSIGGITFGHWLRLLKQNQFKVAPGALPKALMITYLSLLNSSVAKKEEKNFSEQIASTELVADPVFVLGHWRSGTTFLHNILSHDPRFAFTNIFECRNPLTFLSRQKLFEMRKRIQAESRPTDNVQIDFTSPGEEEFPVAILSKMSPLYGWLFPNNDAYWERFATFEDVSQAEQDEWKSQFHYYLKKLTFLYKKQLILKSPLNTGRIRLLHELYPQAKFIHIHRNPYHVFQSTRKMYDTAVKLSALNSGSERDVNQLILERYKTMYDAFMEQKELLTTESFCDVSFEKLESQPLDVLEKIYTDLKIAGFEQAIESFRPYLDSIKGYQKNAHPQLPDDLRKRINVAWEPYFKYWQYEMV